MMEQDTILVGVGAWLLGVLIKSFMDRVDTKRKEENDRRFEKIEVDLKSKADSSRFDKMEEDVEDKLGKIGDDLKRKVDTGSFRDHKMATDTRFECVERDLEKKIGEKDCERMHLGMKEESKKGEAQIEKIKKALITHTHYEEGKGKANTEVIL